MANILFIGEQYLKDKTVLSNNISIDLITPNIEFSQDSDVQTLLGTDLYNSLQTSYSAQTLSSSETVLMGHIKIWLAYLSAANSVPFLAIQLRAKGAVKLNSENQIPAETIDVKYLRDILLKRADYYKEITQNYICQNRDLFPLYKDSDTQLINPKIETFRSGIYFPDFLLNDCSCGNEYINNCQCGH